MSTLPHLKIDFVSDVSCPWCAIGLWALEGALAQLDGELTASIGRGWFSRIGNWP
jgi:predicted DsbA family dithiol-disulfide isomerase